MTFTLFKITKVIKVDPYDSLELINKVENIGKKIENITKENEPNIEDNQNFLSTPPITNISLEELKDLK